MGNNQCAQFSDNPKLPHDQAVKLVLNDLKGTSEKLLIMKNDNEKGIE